MQNKVAFAVISKQERMVKKIIIVTVAIMVMLMKISIIIKIFACIPVEHVHSNENS